MIFHLPPPIHAGIETLLATAIASLLPTIGPISLAAGAGFGFGTGTWLLAQTLATVGGLALLGGAQYLLSPHPSAVQIDPGKMKDTFTAPDSPEVRLVGRGRVSGLQAFGDTAAADRYRLILHCKGTIDAVEAYYVGGREVILDSTGAVSSPPWPADGGSWLYLNSDLGSADKTAWSQLISDFPTLWTSDHRARGITQTLAKYISPGFTDAKFAQLYQGGTPKIEILARGEDTVYDTRTGNTGWSDNGILNALHIILSYPEFSISNFDTSFISSEAERADVAISRYGATTSARARCCGFWTSEVNRGDVVQQVLDSIGAWIVPRTGGTQLGIQLIDDDPDAEFTINASDIIDITWRSGPASVERPNVCRVTYYSPERNYDMGEIDMTGIAWARIDAEVLANGEKPLDIKLPFCPDAGQAQRRARQMFSLARANTGIVHTTFAGMKALGCRVGNIEFPDDFGTLKCLIGPPRILDDQGQVEIPFSVWPTLSAWDVANDEAAPPDVIPDLSLGSLTTPSAPTAATKITYPDLSIVTRVAYVIPSDVLTGAGGYLGPSASVEASYRTYTSGLPNAWQPMTEYLAAAPDLTAHAYVAVDLNGQTVDFRLRTFDGVSSSNWSNVFQVVVPSTNTGPSAPGLALVNDAVNTILTLTPSAPDDLDVSYLQYTGRGAPSSSDAAFPGETLTSSVWTYNYSAVISGTILTWTAQAFSSSGTGGAVTTVNFTVP